MAAVDYSVLDNAAAAAASFYPRRGWTETPAGAVDYAVTVAEGVQLSARFFAVGRDNPTLLFFYGNGETAAVYDDIAPRYNELGINFFVADYRGYGASGGSPCFTALLGDARRVLAWLRATMAALRFGGPLFVIGRSMGRHAAFELAAGAAASSIGDAGTAAGAIDGGVDGVTDGGIDGVTDGGIAGVIIESGRPTLGRFTAGLPALAAQRLEAAYQAKAQSIGMPALVLHGQWDETAPLAEAVGMFNGLRSARKHLEIIPGAGHNDLMYVGYRQYFGAIGRFVGQYGRSSPARATAF